MVNNKIAEETGLKPTQEQIAAAQSEIERLTRELNITNADHVAIWLEANMHESPLGWLACRIVEAHEQAPNPSTPVGGLEGVGEERLLIDARTIAARYLDADMSDVFSGGYDSDPVVCAALDGLRASLPSGASALPCDDCGIPNPTWFAPSPLWNLVMGGPDATDDPGGYICPACFIVRAENAGVCPSAWRLEPEVACTGASDELVEALKPFLKAANLAHNNHITAVVYVSDLLRLRDAYNAALSAPEASERFEYKGDVIEAVQLMIEQGRCYVDQEGYLRPFPEASYTKVLVDAVHAFMTRFGDRDVCNSEEWDAMEAALALHRSSRG